jgi:hypothetical protein
MLSFKIYQSHLLTCSNYSVGKTWRILQFYILQICQPSMYDHQKLYCFLFTVEILCMDHSLRKENISNIQLTLERCYIPGTSDPLLFVNLPSTPNYLTI